MTHKILIENKSTVTIHGLKPGGKMAIDVDRKGVPLNREWRRRLRDSKIDGAIVPVFVDVPVNEEMEG